MTTENNLMARNYVLVLDRSGSMGGPVKGNGGTSRWAAAKESTLAIARACDALDSDGIDVYFFNKTFTRFEGVTAAKVESVFGAVEPMGGTDFVPVLGDVFKNHFSHDKPTTVIVLTDGEPSDLSGQKELAKLLIETANKLEGDAELAVSFIQIGQDPAAAAFLKKLDDGLTSAGAKFDIVDTKTMDDLENMSITDVLLAAIND